MCAAAQPPDDAARLPWSKSQIPRPTARAAAWADSSFPRSDRRGWQTATLAPAQPDKPHARARSTKLAVKQRQQVRECVASYEHAGQSLRSKSKIRRGGIRRGED